MKKHTLIILILLLIAVFLGGLFFISEKNPKVDLAVREIFKLSEEIRQEYKLRPDYWGLRIENVENVLGKNIVVGQGFEGNAAMPGAKSFDIVFFDLNRNECQAMSGFSLNKVDNLGLISISINSDENEFGWNDLPIKSSDSARLCSDTNKILWRFE